METCQMQTFMDLNDPTLWSLLTASYISRWFVNERVQTKNLEIFLPNIKSSKSLGTL